MLPRWLKAMFVAPEPVESVEVRPHASKEQTEEPEEVTTLVHRHRQLPQTNRLQSYPDDAHYLQDELRWIELRVRRIALQRKLLRADQPKPRSRDRLETLLAREQAVRVHIDGRVAAGDPPALDQLVERLGLDDFERTVLLLAAAPCFSRAFEDTFGLLDKDNAPTLLTVEVTFNFAELPFADRIVRRGAFAPTGPLVGNDLLVVDMGSPTSPADLLAASLEITTRAFAYLLGTTDGADELMAFSSVEDPLARLDEVVLPDEHRARIEALITHRADYLALRAAWGLDEVVRYGKAALLLFYGPPGTGKTMTAHGVAERMGKRLLTVDVPTFVAHAEARKLLPGLFREARLQEAVLFFDECETLLRSRSSGNVLMGTLLTELERFEGVAVLATNQPWALDEALDRRILLRVPFSEPDVEARTAIWRRHLPASLPLAPDVDLDVLAARYPLAGGYIKNAVLTALADVLSGAKRDGLTMAHLDEAARSQLARPTEIPLRRPRIGRSDLVVPAAIDVQIDALIAAARAGEGGCVGLIGPAGVGKTRCAEAIAAALGRPLLAADAETLEERLKLARAHRAIVDVDAPGEPMPCLRRAVGLVLVEARSLSQLHPDVRDLLTLLVELPPPRPSERQRLWQLHLPADAKGIDVVALSQRALTGGEISRVVAGAMLRAAGDGAGLSQTHLDAALRDHQIGRRPPGFG